MEKSVFIEKIESFIKKEHLFASGGKYLAAVSGGADSIVMLRVLLHLGIKCEVAHCNFHLRGNESDRDEHFVLDLCNQLGVKCHKADFNVGEYERVHRVSTEMACRDLRYEWFAKLVDGGGFGGVVVAHHSDDNIETFFLNILRGTGITGLTGMQPISYNRVPILRPMLAVSRSDIEAYAAAIGQDYIIDSTNKENVVKRNRLRNVILPALREQFPDTDTAILHTIGNMRDCDKLYRHEIESISKSHIDTSHLPAKIALCDFIDSYIADGSAGTLMFELLRPYGYNYAQSTDIVDAYTSSCGNASGQTFVSGSHQASLSRGVLYIMLTGDDSDLDKEYEISLDNDIFHPTPITVKHISGIPFSPKGIDGKTSVCFSTEILGSRLKLRHWREGDRFRPFGMKGSRLVSDLFSDQKLSTMEKRLVWLLTADEEIVWILGFRASANFPVPKGANEYISLII